MQRGEVWWADLPAPVDRRPILILTRTAAVAARNQVVVAQITRTRHGVASEVVLTHIDWSNAVDHCLSRMKTKIFPNFELHAINFCEIA